MKKILAILAICAVVSMIGGEVQAGFFDRAPEDSRSSSGGRRARLSSVEEAYLAGDYEAVVIAGNKHLSGSSKDRDHIRYLVGRALLKMGRFDEARNSFSRVINDSNTDDLLDESYVGMADSYYLEGKYKEAQDYYAKIGRYFPDSEDMHIVYYRLGECHAKSGNGQESKRYYNKLVKEYPYSLEARLLGQKGSDFITYSVQVGSFTKWSNAKKLCNDLQDKGYDANIHTAVLSGNRYYRVRVGKYTHLGEVEEMARTLRNKGYPAKVYP